MVSWPADHRFIITWSKCLVFLRDLFNQHGAYAVREEFKKISDKTRIYWLDNLYIEPTNPLERLVNETGFDAYSQWSYLKRGLGLPGQVTCDEAEKEAMDRFFEAPTARPSFENISAVSDTLDRWYANFRNVRQMHKRTEKIPYPVSSSSAAIGLTRSKKGQRKFLRDLYLFLKKRPNPFRPSEFSSDINEDRHRTLSNCLSYLDRPLLDHHCFDLNCKNPELHFPFAMQAIPESGARVRCASKPWVSLVYMTEGTQKRLLQGAKRDPIAGPILRDKLGSMRSIVNKRYINSVDFSAATDNFPHEVMTHFQNISMEVKKSDRYLEAPYILKSFGASRLCDSEGVKHLTLHTPQEIARIFFDQNEFKATREQFMYPQSTELSASLLNIVHRFAEHNLPKYEEGLEELKKDVHKYVTTPHPYNIYDINESGERADYDAKFQDFFHHNYDGILEKWMEHYREILYSVPGKLTKKGQHMSLPLSWMSLAALNTTSVYQQCDRPEWLKDRVGRLFSQIGHSPFDTGIELEEKQVPPYLRRRFLRRNGKYLLNSEVDHTISNQKNDFIRRHVPNYKCYACENEDLVNSLEGNDLYEKGMHLIERETGLTSITLGDDAVHASDQLEKIEAVRQFTEDFGCKKHPLKDVLSERYPGKPARMVIGEYLIEDNQFVECLRPGMISQAHIPPEFQWRRIGSFRSSPIYYWHPLKESINNIEEYFHCEKLAKMERLNLPIGIPKDMGGFGLNWPIHPYHWKMYNDLLSCSPSEFFRRLNKIRDAYNPRPENVAWRVTLSMLDPFISLSTEGMSRKNFMELIQSELPEYQFWSDGKDLVESSVQIHNEFVLKEDGTNPAYYDWDRLYTAIRTYNSSLTFDATQTRLRRLRREY